MSSFDPIDSWFEKGFRVRKSSAGVQVKQARRDKTRGGAGGAGPSKRGGVSFSAGAKAANVKAVLKKSPEVVVKITGSNNGMKTAKAHLSYIARNGKVELENEQGEKINGRDELRNLNDAYKAEQIPLESKKREFLHVVFSMPPGADAKGMKQAVKEFCQEEFSNRRYVMALHDDKDHTHVHLCIQTRDKDRADEPRLSPRKADLSRWRLGFADKLREQGIDAAASERRHRFQHQRYEKPAIRQIRADNPDSKAFDAKRAEQKANIRHQRAIERPETAFTGPLRGPRVPRVYQKLNSEINAAVADGKRPVNPALEKMEKNRVNTLAGWEAVEKNLIASDDAESRELAKLVRDLIEKGQKPVVTRNQEVFDNMQNRQSSRSSNSRTTGPEIER